MILPMQTRVRQIRQRGTPRQPNLELKRLRINRGLDRKDLAHLTGVSAESIRLAELGFVPGLRIQFALAQHLGADVLDIWPVEVQR